MRVTNVIAAIWRETRGFLLLAAIVAVVYFELYHHTRPKPVVAATNAPTAISNALTKPPKVTGLNAAISTNSQNSTNPVK